MNWYRRIFLETDTTKQLMVIADACDHYEKQYSSALIELKPPTGLIKKAQMKMAGLVAENYSILQDLEIILEHTQNMEDCVRVNKAKYYKEQYSRDLSDRLAEKYADVHDDVQDLRAIRYRVSSIRNQFLSISKGLEYMHYQITNLTKLQAVGLEDATF